MEKKDIKEELTAEEWDCKHNVFEQNNKSFWKESYQIREAFHTNKWGIKYFSIESDIYLLYNLWQIVFLQAAEASLLPSGQRAASLFTLVLYNCLMFSANYVMSIVNRFSYLWLYSVILPNLMILALIF